MFACRMVMVYVRMCHPSPADRTALVLRLKLRVILVQRNPMQAEAGGASILTSLFWL